jgi:hypothetical protein
MHFSYPLRPAVKVKGPDIKWELCDLVVVAETPVHLSPWACVHDILHLLGSDIDLLIGSLALAKVGVAGEINESTL